jgi:diguanylate cyclase (GGDEF)-like protein/PAS domain S-box-containing protein
VNTTILGSQPREVEDHPTGEVADHLTAIIDHVREAIVTIDVRGAIDYANPAAARLVDTPAPELIGRTFAALLGEPHQDEYAEQLRAFWRGGELPLLGIPREVNARRSDGSLFPIELTLTEMPVGEERMLIGVAREIRERKWAESQLRHMVNHDPVTGLLNRHSFEQELTRHIAYAARHGSAGSVLVLGVDNFQYVNDTLGNDAGDQLLTQMARLVQGRLRQTDVLARIGGDVFAVLLNGTGPEKAQAVARDLLGIVRGHPFVAGKQKVRVTLSGGLTSLEERPVTGSELLAEADGAMYAAKEGGRDRVVLLTAEGRDEAAAKRALRVRIRDATERGLFVLVFQPIVNLTSGETTQYELLLRMRGEDGGLVEPRAFLATAERYGLIQGIDRWVAKQAIRLIAGHRRQGRSLKLEVNLSGKTMSDSNFTTYIARELKTTGIDPASLVFEVTETAAVADIEQARRFAASLAKLGCQFALDDFGSGFASFYYLKHLPISYLKIDGEFVRELPRTPTDQLIIKALVDVCRGLQISTVAEFVGDYETIEVLTELGVDYAQGYHLGRPRPVADLGVEEPAAAD